MSASTDLELLRRHEPILHFTDGELFFPMPTGRYVASFGPFTTSLPAKPVANTCPSADGSSPLNGTNRILKPSIGSGLRFQDPWNTTNAPLRYDVGNRVPV